MHFTNWLGGMGGVRIERQASQAALPSADSLRGLLDSLDMLVGYIDRERRCRFANKAGELWFGRGRDEICGRPLREVVGYAADRVLEAYVDRALAGERLTFSRWLPFDPARPAFVRATFVPDAGAEGRCAGFFLIIEDLTGQLTARSDLRSALDRLARHADDYIAGMAAPERGRAHRPSGEPEAAGRAGGGDAALARQIVETSAALVLVTDAAGRLRVFNRAAEWLTGYRREDVLGRPLLPVLVPPAWHAAVEAVLAPPAQFASRAIEMPLLTADGRQRTVVWRLAPIELRGEAAGRVHLGFEVGGDPLSSLPLFRRHDRRFGRLLRRYAVAEVTTALLHELSQPLSAVLGFTQGSLRLIEQNGARTRDVVDSLAKAVAQAHRLGEIVRLVRRQVRVEESRPARVPTDINTLVAVVAERVRSEAAAAGIEIRLDLAAGLAPVPCDPAEIEHVLLSIVGDSIDSLETHPQQPRWVRLATAGAGEAVEISITDSGPGIADLVAGRLFDPFVGGSLTGAGLGLAVCRTLVRGHNGELWLDEQDRGSIFRLKLPIQLKESVHVV